MRKRDFPPIHPGEILLTEFLEPLGISQYRLAKDIFMDVPSFVPIIYIKAGQNMDFSL
jgi:plasmid maintenance system antidote protein VapI